uniref:Ig-like domain-containing protein n=1 Tax=Macrostomum lignano TaxID=282301 RepID=A0A1I8GW14_9PLAT
MKPELAPIQPPASGLSVIMKLDPRLLPMPTQSSRGGGGGGGGRGVHVGHGVESEFVHIVWSLLEASEPEVVYPQGNQISIRQGKTLIVKCRARGKPNPKILWIKNGRNLVLTSNVRIEREEVNSEDETQHQLVSTLRISRILERDSGNYTCRAENNHGSIQKWVFVDGAEALAASRDAPASGVAKAILPAFYCLNNGTCSRQSVSSPPACNCSQPYWGARCERVDTGPFRNFSETCRGKVLDCFHRTDRILTVTGIGLVLTMLLLILLISWYLS